MIADPLLEKIRFRVASDKDDGDIAYFHALMFEFEYIAKLLTAGVVAFLADEPERHRYSLEYKLVRADSLGNWREVLNNTLMGPASHFLRPAARLIARNLTERVPEGERRYNAVCQLHKVAKHFELDSSVGPKVALRQFFEIGVSIRNRTRGHGAPTSTQCSLVCPLLAEALDLALDEIELFKYPWAYVHRNLSGKYRVSPLLGDSSPFEYLKRTRDVALPNGVFVFLDEPIHIPLVFSDPDVRDIFLPNGNFKRETFEALSYLTNEVKRIDGSHWINPPGRLPPSETEGRAQLELVGNVFANLPPIPSGRIPRLRLERRVREELEETNRHPIVTLTGPGGIGKTTVALAAIAEIAKRKSPPYDVILWMSARDIDLLETGPKPVTPRVVRKEEIARVAVELLEPRERNNKGFSSEAYFESILAKGAAGPTLFVFDNFETLESPVDVFNWIDTYIRPPNKVLITTRFRDFSGDYPIVVGGMTDEEANQLINQEVERLGIRNLVSEDYREELIKESEGHPYVIKILLGQVAAEGRAVKPERIVASSERILTALFERTYGALSPGAQRVFLLLCSWRVFLPTVAVEAVALRPGNERVDISSALDELKRFSLVEEITSKADDERFVGVPLAAATFGRRKLEVSPFKVAVEEDKKLLMEFGAGKREDVQHGALPRIERLMRSVANRASEDPEVLTRFLPILEYLASRVPRTYLRLADLMIEIHGVEKGGGKAKNYLRRFLETAQVHEKQKVWLALADLCRDTGDALEEVHALSEAALLPTTTPEEIGVLANRINRRIHDLKGQRVEDAWSPEVRLLIERVADAMERHRSDLSATDCSRLAWLYLNIGREDRARDIARRGLERDLNNEHCLKLAERLGL